ncbi:MAG TPA: DUF433 domain-containing protein [Candidatus Paceibacterota bacterium]
MKKSKLITIEAGKRGGKATIRGMRISVDDVLKMLASGMTPEEVISDFPELTKNDILAALEYASRREGGVFVRAHETFA